jgi:hypothetical protein
MTSRERAEAWGFWEAVPHGLLVYSYGGVARRGQRDFTYSPAAVAQVSSIGPLLYPYFYPLHESFRGDVYMFAAEVACWWDDLCIVLYCR